MPDLISLAFLQSILGIAVVVAGIGFLIFVHELGHFLVAKWCKVRIEAFSLGFGWVLWKFRKGETEYRLSAIPLGGYVKMAGELPTDDHSDDPRELQNKSILARAAIFSAGVVMNAITAIVFFIIAYNVGVPLVSPVLGTIEPGSPAEEADLHPGDRVLTVDGKQVVDFEDFVYAIAFSNGTVDLEVERNGERVRLNGIQPRKDAARGIYAIGAHLSYDRSITIDRDGPAYEAGLRTGDQLIDVDGVSPADHQMLQRVMGDTPGPLEFRVRRGDEVLTRAVQGTSQESEDAPRIIGVQPFVTGLGGVRAGSRARDVGFRAGDTFLEVNGEPAEGYYLALEKAKRAAPGAVTFTVRREKEREKGTLSIGPVEGLATPADWDRFFLDLLPATGSQDSPPRISLLTDHDFEDGNPARKAGLPEGALVLKVNGNSVKDYSDLREQILATPDDEPVRITWRADGQEHGPVEIYRRRQIARVFGISFAPATEIVRVPGILAACGRGLDKSLQWGRRVLMTIGGLFSGRVSAKTLGGPVAIAVISYDAARRDFMHFLHFLAILSINLAVLNLLPIPILDGGHLLFLLIEAIRGKPLPESAMALFQWAGLLLLLMLMAFVIVNDVSRLIP